MIEQLSTLRHALESERLAQIGRLEALERQVAALKAKLAVAASADDHPVPALTVDMASLAGFDPVRATARETLEAVCAVRLVGANRATLDVFHVNDAAHLVASAGALFGAALIDPFARFAHAAARGGSRFAQPVVLRDSRGATLRGELRAAVPPLGATDRVPVTFAFVDAASLHARLVSAPEAAQDAADDRAREAA